MKYFTCIGSDSLRKRKVDYVIKTAFWEGFQDGLGDGVESALEYASTSGLYAYNDVRRIAAQAGYRTAQRLLDEACERRRSGKRKISMGYRYGVPADVVAACYAEARIADKWST